jgi:hypothetical protein
MMRGVAYVAFGPPAVREVQKSIEGLRQNNDFPVSVITDSDIKGVDLVRMSDPGPGARRAKLQLPELVGYERCLYLDADTRVRGDVSPLFEPLEAGFDMVITPSSKQHREQLWHLGDEEREHTFRFLRNPWPLVLQGGVFCYARQAVRALFERWLLEWERRQEADQGALLRALEGEPLKMWLMGAKTWNKCGIIEHRFGACVM